MLLGGHICSNLKLKHERDFALWESLKFALVEEGKGLAFLLIPATLTPFGARFKP